MPSGYARIAEETADGRRRPHRRGEPEPLGRIQIMPWRAASSGDARACRAFAPPIVMGRLTCGRELVGARGMRWVMVTGVWLVVLGCGKSNSPEALEAAQKAASEYCSCVEQALARPRSEL